MLVHHRRQKRHRLGGHHGLLLVVLVEELLLHPMLLPRAHRLVGSVGAQAHLKHGSTVLLAAPHPDLGLSPGLALGLQPFLAAALLLTRLAQVAELAVQAIPAYPMPDKGARLACSKFVERRPSARILRRPHLDPRHEHDAVGARGAGAAGAGGAWVHPRFRELAGARLCASPGGAPYVAVAARVRVGMRAAEQLLLEQLPGVIRAAYVSLAALLAAAPPGLHAEGVRLGGQHLLEERRGARVDPSNTDKLLEGGRPLQRCVDESVLDVVLLVLPIFVLAVVLLAFVVKGLVHLVAVVAARCVGAGRQIGGVHEELAERVSEACRRGGAAIT
mmetsp:Transcript_23633/g.67789  ORF Transcript_23633/g.67789 Transcript_23633/m.67789 type:complete len:332 (+) Transcript_23633:208-1203(+)